MTTTDISIYLSQMPGTPPKESAIAIFFTIIMAIAPLLIGRLRKAQLLTITSQRIKAQLGEIMTTMDSSTLS